MSRNSVYRRELKKKATPQELKVKAFLEDRKIRFQFQRGFIRPYHRIVDFYIQYYEDRKIRLIIEVDGGYHQTIREKDELKDRTAWEERKMKTLRITNGQVDDGSFETKILLALGGTIDDRKKIISRTLTNSTSQSPYF